MSTTPLASRAEIVMDCIAVIALAVLVGCTFIFVARSPALPFAPSRACQRAAELEQCCAKGSSTVPCR